MQTGLSAVGLVPGAGEGADLANAAISTARGNYGEAAVDLGGALGPVGSDPRLFPWSCIVWLSPSAGDELSLKLLHFLIRHFEPAFGFITTNEDHRDKHFLSFEDIDGVTEMYVGQDILENEETLPGVCWLTYFGPWAVERIGNERFADLKAEKVKSIDGGYLVQAYGSGSQAGEELFALGLRIPAVYFYNATTTLGTMPLNRFAQTTVSALEALVLSMHRGGGILDEWRIIGEFEVFFF